MSGQEPDRARTASRDRDVPARGGRLGSVFLLSDFGTADEFAGVVRAVVLREAPGCPVVDLTHEIPSFDVRAGALALERTVPHLGRGVVVAVVDPGVGTERRVVAVSVVPGAGPGFLIGPDNGLLGFAVEVLGGTTGAVALAPATWRLGTGATFDARDVFAPAAARLWSGARLEDLGVPIDAGTLVHLPPPRLEVEPGVVHAEVLWVDRYGNVQLSARPADALSAGLDADLIVVVRRATFVTRRSTSFVGDEASTQRRAAAGPGSAGGDADEGDAVGLITDSNGHLALVCRQRSAAIVLGVLAGDMVIVRNGERTRSAVAGGATS
ncbi:MAG: SAM-dependent chlorinase/fluorinase [Acidimicrobiales bacterium]